MATEAIINPETTNIPALIELVDQAAYFNIDLENLYAKVSIYLIENFLNCFFGELLKILADTVGINVIEINTEIRTETEIAIPISLNNCPIGKSNNKIGINTTTVVRADPNIGAQT